MSSSSFQHPVSDTELETALAPLNLSNRAAAARIVRQMAAESGAAAVLPYLLSRLEGTAGTERILVYLERLTSRARAEGMNLFERLARQPQAVELLIRLFSSSQFLAEILLRHPAYLDRLVDNGSLARQKTAAEFLAEAQRALLGAPTPPEPLNALRRYQRGELLRIGAGDLLDQLDLPGATVQLSNLADAMVQAALDVTAAQHGLDPAGFAVLALGKLGGRELNYSSDIDLVFVCAGDDPRYTRLGRALIEAVAGITPEGFLYRVDMRLRPWGRTGALAPSLEAVLGYLSRQARLWEKQALLKARFIAGDAGLGAEFIRRATPLVFSSNGQAVRAEVAGMKQRTEEYLRQRGRDWGEVKLGEGSIRDVEFVVQYLQLIHGARQPEVRSRNTLDAIHRLTQRGCLPVEESRVLADGYLFLRTVEHHLQIMNYRQAYSLPSDPAALDQLAHRLGFQGPDAAQAFLARYQSHSAAIRAVYLNHLGGAPMTTPEPTPGSTPEARRHIARMDPSYEAAFTPTDIERHAELAERLNPDHLVEVETVPLEDGYWRVTIVAYDYPGELSLICGLFLAYDLNIFDGSVFTYEPLPEASGREARRKIVDLFTVRPASGEEISLETWSSYTTDLEDLLKLMQAGERQAASFQLAKRVAAALHGLQRSPGPLYPIEIEIDNETSERYTVLGIASQDTVGFLYELTNALAFQRVYIARVAIETAGKRVQDVLYVTDEQGRKITAANRQRELRAATVLAKHFTHLLPHSPDPETALLHFREFISRLFQRPNWPDELASLERPEVLNVLARLLGVSDFLWDDFLRMQHANLFPVVSDVDALKSAKSREQLQAELEAALLPVHKGPQPPAEDAPWREVLNAFKDREMLRIDMRHILGHTQELWDFARELSDLVEVVVNAAYHLAAEDLRLVYGSPLLENGQPAEMSVLALGKIGGREPGFASDIELMFVYEGNGKTTGPTVITTAEFYEKVVESFVRAIRAKREGVFEIDLQLRPYGKAGSLAVALEAFRRYFQPGGPAWPYERQALVKMRPVAGSPELGRRLEDLRDRFVYTGEPFNATAMRAMRERQIMHHVKGGTFNPKLSPGGLVDVEYLVQGLQITHGAENPRLRATNTREAMAALAEAGILSEEDYPRLRRAHTFLRWLIDGQRMVAGNTRDLVVPNEGSEEFLFLARRLRYGDDTAQLKEDLLRHTAFVQEINRRLLP